MMCPDCKTVLTNAHRPAPHLLDYHDRARCPQCLTIWQKDDGLYRLTRCEAAVVAALPPRKPMARVRLRATV